MGDFPKADLYEYVDKFQPLIQKIQNAALGREGLYPGDLADIEKAKIHPFITWLEKEEYFEKAKHEIEEVPFYLEKVKNTEWRDNWWIQLKTVVAEGFYVYCEAEKEFPDRLVLDSKRKKRIKKLTGKLLDEIKDIHILGQVADIALHDFLTELKTRLDTDNTSELSLSGKHEKYPRQLLVKYLAVSAENLTYNPYTETSQVNTTIIGYLVAIIDPPKNDIEEHQRTIRDIVNSKLGPEFEANRIARRIVAAGMVARQFPVSTNPCPYCWQAKSIESIEG